jgi:hypothetical protein
MRIDCSIDTIIVFKSFSLIVFYILLRICRLTQHRCWNRITNWYTLHGRLSSIPFEHFLYFEWIRIRQMGDELYILWFLHSNSEDIVSPRAHCSVVGWDTMIQVGMSRVRFPMRSLDFFNWPNSSSRTMGLESTQSLTETSTRNLPGGKGWPACKADILSAIWEPIV